MEGEPVANSLGAIRAAGSRQSRRSGSPQEIRCEESVKSRPPPFSREAPLTSAAFRTIIRCNLMPISAILAGYLRRHHAPQPGMHFLANFPVEESDGLRELIASAGLEHRVAFAADAYDANGRRLPRSIAVYATEVSAEELFWFKLECRQPRPRAEAA